MKSKLRLNLLWWIFVCLGSQSFTEVAAQYSSIKHFENAASTVAITEFFLNSDSSVSVFGSCDSDQVYPYVGNIGIFEFSSTLQPYRQKLFGLPGAGEQGVSCTRDALKGYFFTAVTGNPNSESPPFGKGIMYLVDSNLNRLWGYTLSIASKVAFPNFSIGLRDGNFLVGGVVHDSIVLTPFSDSIQPMGWLAKVNRAGSVIWCKKYKRNQWDFTSAVEGKDGFIYVTGGKGAAVGGYLLKLNILGNIVWDASDLGMRANKVLLNNQEQIIVLGTESRRATLRVFDKLTGKCVMMRRFNQPFETYTAFGMDFDSIGNAYVILCGESSTYDHVLIKLDSDFQRVWQGKLKGVIKIINEYDKAVVRYDHKRNKIWISGALSVIFDTRPYIAIIDTSSSFACMNESILFMDTSNSQYGKGYITSTTVSNHSLQMTPIVLDSYEYSSTIVTDCITCDTLSPKFTYTFEDSTTLVFTPQNLSPFVKHVTWHFGDKDSSSLISPKHKYTKNGNYSVKLVVYNESMECKDSLIKTLTISSTCNQLKPQLRYTYIDSSTVDFEALYDTTIAELQLWNLGDGRTSKAIRYVHNYTDTGNYIVKAIVKSKFNACIDSSSINVRVNKLSTGMLEQTSDFFFAISPNPGYKKVTVVSEKLVRKIVVRSLHGVVVRQIEGMPSKEHEIECEDLPEGCYFLELYSEMSGVGYAKFIKLTQY